MQGRHQWVDLSGHRKVDIGRNTVHTEGVENTSLDVRFIKCAEKRRHDRHHQVAKEKRPKSRYIQVHDKDTYIPNSLGRIERRSRSYVDTAV